MGISVRSVVPVFKFLLIFLHVGQSKYQKTASQIILYNTILILNNKKFPSARNSKCFLSIKYTKLGFITAGNEPSKKGPTHLYGERAENAFRGKKKKKHMAVSVISFSCLHSHEDWDQTNKKRKCFPFSARQTAQPACQLSSHQKPRQRQKSASPLAFISGSHKGPGTQCKQWHCLLFCLLCRGEISCYWFSQPQDRDSGEISSWAQACPPFSLSHPCQLQ